MKRMIYIFKAFESLCCYDYLLQMILIIIYTYGAGFSNYWVSSCRHGWCWASVLLSDCLALYRLVWLCICLYDPGAGYGLSRVSCSLYS